MVLPHRPQPFKTQHGLPHMPCCRRLGEEQQAEAATANCDLLLSCLPQVGLVVLQWEGCVRAASALCW